MRVFVSYSFIDKELYLITLLVSKLREKGNIVQLSDAYYLSESYINNADMFVGIITNNSHSINDVFNEYFFAEKYNKQRVLLIEEGVQVYQNNIKHIRFDRTNPQLAINQLFKNKNSIPTKKTSVVEDIITAGAVIAGIAALLTLLSDDGSKSKIKKLK